MCVMTDRQGRRADHMVATNVTIARKHKFRTAARGGAKVAHKVTHNTQTDKTYSRESESKAYLFVVR
jgi:hypothetical protein